MKVSEKQKIVENINALLQKSNSIVISDFSGMTVELTDILRKKFHESGATYQVIKNTLLKRAVQDTDMAKIDPFCKGPTAVAIGYEDPAAPARIFRDFLKDNPDKLKIKGGYLSGSAIDVEGVKRLADMPTFAELRAQLLGVISAPAQKVAAQIAAASQQLVGVVQAHIDDAKDK